MDRVNEMSALDWLKPAVVVAGAFFATAPAQAQDVTVLRGSPPRPTASIDCNDPYYAQYCPSSGASSAPYDGVYHYGGSYPYYSYAVPVGVRHRFHLHRGGNSHNRLSRAGFHGGGFSGGGFHGIGFGGGLR